MSPGNTPKSSNPLFLATLHTTFHFQSQSRRKQAAMPKSEVKVKFSSLSDNLDKKDKSMTRLTSCDR